MVPVERVSVAVVYSAAPGQVDEVSLQLPVGSTLSQALLASGLLDHYRLRLQAVQTGIWGRLQSLETVLRDNDRVELYRPLQVDPKEARRLRYGQHKVAAQARKDRLLAVKPATPAAGG